MNDMSSAPAPPQQGEQRHAFPSQLSSPPLREQAVEARGRLQQNRIGFILLVTLTATTIVGTIIWALSILGILHATWAGVIGVVLSAMGILLTLWPLDAQAVASATLQHAFPGRASLWARKEKSPLHVTVGKRFRHTTIVLYRGFHEIHRPPVAAIGVSERLVEGESVYVATFPAVEPGNYTVATQHKECIAIVTVYAGLPAWVDLR